MKKLILISAFLISALLSSSQTDTNYTGVDTSQFRNYSTCMTCGEQWSTSNQVNQYATGQNKSQQRTLSENAMASQTVNSSKRFIRGIGATVIGVFIAAATMAIITKTTESTNALFR